MNARVRHLSAASSQFFVSGFAVSDVSGWIFTSLLAGPKLNTQMPALQSLPTAYVPHGGGPWPFVPTGIGTTTELAALAEYLRSISALPERPIRALLVVSAHWEEQVPTVTIGERPPLVYDYYGFPPESYRSSGQPPANQRLRHE